MSSEGGNRTTNRKGGDRNGTTRLQIDNISTSSCKPTAAHTAAADETAAGEEVAHTRVASRPAAAEAVAGVAEEAAGVAGAAAGVAKHEHHDQDSHSLVEEDEHSYFGSIPNVHRRHHHHDHVVAPTGLDEYLRGPASRTTSWATKS